MLSALSHSAMKQQLCVILFFLSGIAWGTEVPDVFSDHMIVQRESLIPVWGRADDGTKITVTFAGEAREAVAKNGVWRVEFPAMSANKVPQVLKIVGSDGFENVCSNVLVGDVWLAAGQSNMALTLENCKSGAAVIPSVDNPMIRLFTVSKALASKPGLLGTTWYEANPASASSQSAVGYFFVDTLQRELDIPVGLIHCAYGGTPTETWCSPDVLSASFPRWEAYEKALRNKPKKFKKVKTSSFLYEHMLKTVLPFSVKGFIWYQGEANTSRSEEQRKLFPAMVADWRQSWGNDELPFYFVQLARFEQADWHEFRNAQREIAAALPHSYLAVTIDLSREWFPDNHPIHPATKQPIGQRLAGAALANVYGQDIVYSGPMIEAMQVNGAQAVLSFEHLGGGLTTKDGKPPRGFYLSDDGENFVEASAVITGETVTLSASSISAPVAVRYGAEKDMGMAELDVNLANAEGLPASPFTLMSHQ